MKRRPIARITGGARVRADGLTRQLRRLRKTFRRLDRALSRMSPSERARFNAEWKALAVMQLDGL